MYSGIYIDDFSLIGFQDMFSSINALIFINTSEQQRGNIKILKVHIKKMKWYSVMSKKEIVHLSTLC